MRGLPAGPGRPLAGAGREAGSVPALLALTALRAFPLAGRAPFTEPLEFLPWGGCATVLVLAARDAAMPDLVAFVVAFLVACLGAGFAVRPCTLSRAPGIPVVAVGRSAPVIRCFFGLYSTELLPSCQFI